MKRHHPPQLGGCASNVFGPRNFESRNPDRKAARVGITRLFPRITWHGNGTYSWPWGDYLWPGRCACNKRQRVQRLAGYAIPQRRCRGPVNRPDQAGWSGAARGEGAINGVRADAFRKAHQDGRPEAAHVSAGWCPGPAGLRRRPTLGPRFPSTFPPTVRGIRARVSNASTCCHRQDRCVTSWACGD
jgi:hypothetical protein